MITVSNYKNTNKKYLFKNKEITETQDYETGGRPRLIYSLQK